MKVLTVYRTASNAWISSIAVSSGPLCLTRSDDASPKLMTVPVPMFMLGYESTAGASFGTKPSLPRPTAAAEYTPLDRPMIAVEAPAPPRDAPLVSYDVLKIDDAPETRPLSEPAPRRTDRIDLIIDSLPHHRLIEPIPVTMQPLGDKVFMATIPDLNITTTGNTVGESLLLLKEQIEYLYEDLSKQLKLDDDRKRDLRLLQTYISRDSKKSKWYLK